MTVTLDPVAPAIDRITVHVVTIRRTRHNRVTHTYGTTPDPRYALVEVEAGGVVGVGEAPTEIWWTGEDADSVRWAIEHHLEPALRGKPSAVGDAVRAMDGALYGNPYAKAAIQMALWDILGKRARMPLHELLGAAAAAPVPIKYGIGWGEIGHIREELARGREHGLHFFKLKVGQQLRLDLRRATAAVEALEDGEQLGLDVNGGWSLAVAIRALPALRELGIAFLEQPVAREEFSAMAEVARRSEVPIMAHEMLTNRASAVTLAAQGAAQLWSLTPSMHGGIAQTLDMLAIARAHGIRCLLGSTFELGIASAHMLHLAGAVSDIHLGPVPSDIPAQLYLERDVIAERFELSDGCLRVPTGPGLGVTPDWDVISACAS